MITDGSQSTEDNMVKALLLDGSRRVRSSNHSDRVQRIVDVLRSTENEMSRTMF